MFSGNTRSPRAMWLPAPVLSGSKSTRWGRDSRRRLKSSARQPSPLGSGSPVLPTGIAAPHLLTSGPKADDKPSASSAAPGVQIGGSFRWRYGAQHEANFFQIRKAPLLRHRLILAPRPQSALRLPRSRRLSPPLVTSGRRARGGGWGLPCRRGSPALRTRLPRVPESLLRSS